MSLSSPLLDDCCCSCSLTTGRAATLPHCAHWIQCECHLWYVPSRTQSSSTVTPHRTHKSDGGFDNILPPVSLNVNGDSPTFSGARLRNPYVTPWVPRLA